MTLPAPEPGLVISYSYLWLDEHRVGREEGVKDRPCAIILAAKTASGTPRLLVLPVTHRHPDDGRASLEVPASIKRHLGLDEDRSWIVLSESNVFDWPGPDLRRIARRDGASAFAYGFLPPRFFAEVRRRYLALTKHRSSVVPRSD